MQEFAAEWYAILSRLNGAVAGPVGAVGERLDVPVLSALLFGLIGATSPCQLTTNAGALAYFARGTANRRAVASTALAYVLGKALVYTLLGLAVILAGRRLAQDAIPVIVVARKVLGPLMVLLGLYLFGLVPLRFSLGRRLATRLQAQAGSGTGGAFVLGIAFSLAFCPTLALLFFGLTIPLALRSPIGVVYPGVFALGTALPLLGMAVAVTVGAGLAQGYLVGVRRVNAFLKPVAAAVLVFAGLNDTVVYWFL